MVIILTTVLIKYIFLQNKKMHPTKLNYRRGRAEILMNTRTHRQPKTKLCFERNRTNQNQYIKIILQQTPQPNIHPVGRAPTPKPDFKQYFAVNM